jgi:hypothetical protein
MAKVKVGIAGKTKAEVLTYAKGIHTGLTGNPYVTTPSPTPAALQTKITAAETAEDDFQAAKDTAATKKELRDAAFVDLENALRAEAVTVQTATGGIRAEIVSTGFEVADSPTTHPAPDQVLNLRVTASDSEGVLKASWKRVLFTQQYEYESCVDPITPTGWVMKGSTKKTRVSVNSFTSGQKIWLRVRAVNAAGDGAWSDPAAKIVP